MLLETTLLLWRSQPLSLRPAFHTRSAAEEDFALLLISLPDLASQLAETMHRLFQGSWLPGFVPSLFCCLCLAVTAGLLSSQISPIDRWGCHSQLTPLVPLLLSPADFGVAAWKLKARQRRQLAGMVHHHMVRVQGAVLGGGECREGVTQGPGCLHAPAPPCLPMNLTQPPYSPFPPSRQMHWNRHGRPAAASAAAARGYDSDNEGEGGPRAGPHPHRAHLRSAGGTSHRHPSQGHLLSTSLLMDREVFRRLKRMQAALEALSMQVRGSWKCGVGPWDGQFWHVARGQREGCRDWP